MGNYPTILEIIHFGVVSSSSSSTFIDNKESYKQISCVEHFYMC